MSARPLAGICACKTPMHCTSPDTRRPFACLMCRQVMRLPDLLTLADIAWLRGKRIELGPIEP